MWDTEISDIPGAISFSTGWQFDNRSFTWKPLPDITTYELAQALPILIGGGHHVGKAYDSLPANVQRHFEARP